MDRSRLPYIARIIHARPRLFLSVLVGAVAVPLLSTQWPMMTRALAGWDIGVLLYLGLSFRLMANESIPQIKRRAADDDEGGLLILILSVSAAVVSLLAILLQLGLSSANGYHLAELVFAIATVMLSWFFVHSIFALHYAHGYYGDHADAGGGLIFPGKDKPDYGDFLYFSFVIGMTSQVSDVQVTQKSIRRMVLVHGILSFFFNIALLALTFNIAAGALQKS